MARARASSRTRAPGGRGRVAVRPASPRRARARQAAMIFTNWFLPTTTPPQETGTAKSRRACFLRWYEPDQVPRVCGRTTLSALVALPGGELFNCRNRSTGRSRARHGSSEIERRAQSPPSRRSSGSWSDTERWCEVTSAGVRLRARARRIANAFSRPDLLADPLDHVVDDGRALGLVVQFVAQARVFAPRHACELAKCLAGGRRHEPVVGAMDDERREGQAGQDLPGRAPARRAPPRRTAPSSHAR